MTENVAMSNTVKFILRVTRQLVVTQYEMRKERHDGGANASNGCIS